MNSIKMVTQCSWTSAQGGGDISCWSTEGTLPGAETGDNGYESLHGGH